MNGIVIGKHQIGFGAPVFIVAEMSANHNQNFDQAVQIIKAAKDAGADAVKLQTYTPDTLTIDCDNSYFKVGRGTTWEGRSLYELYGEAYTPWEWQPRLKKLSEKLGMELFSTPFDNTAVDFLETMDVPVYKIASFEIVDLQLIRCIAKTGKPIILSTGMASLAEIEDAVRIIRRFETTQLALLKCTSGYPSAPEEMHLRTIPHMAETFEVPVGLSDHTLGIAVPVAAVALGACIIEKHFTLSRKISGPDSSFSLEPEEFSRMVKAIRVAEASIGKIHYRTGTQEANSSIFRRSLFVVRDVRAGDVFTESNLRSIRPGYGLSPRFLNEILGRKAASDIKRGTPLGWGHLINS